MAVALWVVATGCEVETGYGGGYAPVYGEYPYAYYGQGAAPVYVYPYAGWAPYDRDHYWDRDRYWEQHRWHGDYGWGGRRR